MSRDYFINGECMVYVKGNSSSSISTLTELGLSMDQVQIKPNFRHKPIKVDNWWECEPEVQVQMQNVMISMTLVHFDPAVLDVVIQESMGGVAAPGVMPRAGTRLGNGLARFAVGGGKANHFIGLNLTSPVASKPWRFYHCYLADSPYNYPIGVERSPVTLNFKAIPYAPDPWNGGSGLAGVVIYDHTLDS